MKDQDIFSQPFGMKLDDRESSSRSWFGAFCSLIIFILVVTFTYIKFDTLMTRKDVDILSTISDYHFNEMDRFGYENGFNVAVAFTDYSHDTEWQLDPTYGTLTINSYSWYEQEDDYDINRVPLDTHNCTREELGLTEGREGAKFLPAHYSYQAFLETHWKKLICAP